MICGDGFRVGFDYLIIGNGITTNHFGIPGAAEYTMSMYTRAEALRVRDTIFGSLEIIAGQSDPNTGGFTVVIVGGGPTGVEMAGQLAELKTETIPSTYPELNPAHVHVVLVEMTEHLLAPFDDSLRQYALRELTKRGVDVRLKTAISEVEADRVDFKDGSSMPVDLVIWAAGVSGDPRLRDWGLPIGRAGRIEINDDTRVVGEERIFAIGDGSVIVNNPLAAAGAAGDPDGQVCCSTDRPAASWTGDRVLPLSRQGHHGDDRSGRCGAGDADRPQAQGCCGLDRVDRAAPVLPARRAQPGTDVDQLRFSVPRPAPLERDRGRCAGDAEAAGDECQGRTAGRCIASAP